MTTDVQISPGNEAVGETGAPRGRRLGVLLLVLAVAAGIRIIDFPQRYEFRQEDEMGYLQGGLDLAEGLTPGLMPAPAGPLMWTSWAYVNGQAVWYFLHPTPREQKITIQVRPFLALDRSLFDTYRDMSSLHRFFLVLNVGLAVIAVAAATGLGFELGGVIGGLTVGGLFAVLPILVGFSEMSRPYSQAWSFGMISLYFASRSKESGKWGATGAFLGLSIGSRIEMLGIIPLIWWLLWSRRKSRGLIGTLAKTTLLGLGVAVFVAPWLMTNMSGVMRSVATVRMGSGQAHVNWTSLLSQFFWEQGLIGAFAIAAAGVALRGDGARLRAARVLAVYVAFMLFSMTKGDSNGLYYHGAVLLSLLLLTAATIGELYVQYPRATAATAAIALLLPLLQCGRMIRQHARLYDHDDSTAWIEQHVPAGTTIYFMPGGFRLPLPTPASAEAIWTEVTDDQAWRKKFESGLQRFNIASDQMPRAMADENLIAERGNRRQWFILAGHTDLPDPRYDVRIVLGSPVFGIRDLISAMKQQGGVLVWRDLDAGYGLQMPDLGPPLAQWLNEEGKGVSIYTSPELRDKIKMQ